MFLFQKYFSNMYLLDHLGFDLGYILSNRGLVFSCSELGLVLFQSSFSLVLVLVYSSLSLVLVWFWSNPVLFFVQCTVVGGGDSFFPQIARALVLVYSCYSLILGLDALLHFKPRLKCSQYRNDAIQLKKFLNGEGKKAAISKSSSFSTELPRSYIDCTSTST